MPGRSYQSTPTYSFGMQGQQTDQEIITQGMVEFELRFLETRLGRWMSPDPYHSNWSPYVSMANNPISYIDPNGGKEAMSNSSNNVINIYNQPNPWDHGFWNDNFMTGQDWGDNNSGVAYISGTGDNTPEPKQDYRDEIANDVLLKENLMDVATTNSNGYDPEGSCSDEDPDQQNPHSPESPYYFAGDNGWMIPILTTTDDALKYIFRGDVGLHSKGSHEYVTLETPVVKVGTETSIETNTETNLSDWYSCLQTHGSLDNYIFSGAVKQTVKIETVPFVSATFKNNGTPLQMNQNETQIKIKVTPTRTIVEVTGEYQYRFVYFGGKATADTEGTLVLDARVTLKAIEGKLYVYVGLETKKFNSLKLKMGVGGERKLGNHTFKLDVYVFYEIK